MGHFFIQGCQLSRFDGFGNRLSQVIRFWIGIMISPKQYLGIRCLQDRIISMSQLLHDSVLMLIHLLRRIVLLKRIEVVTVFNKFDHIAIYMAKKLEPLAE